MTGGRREEGRERGTTGGQQDTRRGLIKKRSARSVGGLTARKARKDNRRAAGLETRRRRGWIGRGRGARRGALAERARVWFGGGGELIEWVVGCSGVRHEAPVGVSTKVLTSPPPPGVRWR